MDFWGASQLRLFLKLTHYPASLYRSCHIGRAIRVLFRLTVAVGTTITDRPPHRSVRARLRIRLLPWINCGRIACRTPPVPWDMQFPLCVGSMWDRTMFSTARALPSPTSAEGFPPLFGWFTGTTAQSDFSSTCMSAVRFMAFADRP